MQYNLGLLFFRKFMVSMSNCSINLEFQSFELCYLELLALGIRISSYIQSKVNETKLLVSRHHIGY
jgi:hypothetical protein